jgi:hypothetical protein
MAAAPPAAHRAVITLTAPIDRRSGAANAASWFNISFLPYSLVGSSRVRSDIGTTVGTRITGIQYKNHLCDIIVNYDPTIEEKAVVFAEFAPL